MALNREHTSTFNSVNNPVSDKTYLYAVSGVYLPIKLYSLRYQPAIRWTYFVVMWHFYSNGGATNISYVQSDIFSQLW